MKVFARGQMVPSATSGFGFILVAGHLANDANAAVLFTDSTYPGNSTSGLGPPGVNVANFNSPFAIADFGANIGLEWRVVSLGVRARYAGTELERGGSVVTLEEPDHQALGNGRGYTDLQAYDKAYAQAVDREWVSTTHQPVTTADFNFTRNSLVNAGNHYLCIAVQAPFTGGVPSTQPWEFEVYLNIECIGPLARMKIPAQVDRTGAETVIAAVAHYASSTLGRMSRTMDPATVLANVYRAYRMTTNATPTQRMLRY